MPGESKKKAAGAVRPNAAGKEQRVAGLKLTEFLDAAPDAVLVVDREGRIVFANARVRTMFGYTADELLGESVEVLLPERLRGGHAAHRGSYLAAPEPRPMGVGLNLAGRRKDGGEFPVDVSLSPIHLRGGTITVAAVRDMTGRESALERRYQERVQSLEQELVLSERRLRTFFTSAPVGLAIMDRDLRFILINDTLAEMHGLPAEEHLGRTVPEVLPEFGPVLEPVFRKILATGEPALNWEQSNETPAEPGVARHWAASHFPIPGPDGRPHWLGAIVVETTKQKRAEADIRRLSNRLMQVQDEERRNIARQLHDTTAQSLVSLQLNLKLLDEPAARLDESARRVLSESLALVDQSIQEVRTLSYLLHPPLLDDAGLVSALRWYVTGFAERSGIQVTLDVASDFEASPRLPREIETTLFRVVQECLSNVHRHAGSPTATVRLRRDMGNVLLKVADEGRGLPISVGDGAPGGDVLLGVGIAGMRERLQQFGGSLEIDSSSRGTTVSATVPQAPRKGASGA